jgi:magnesium and cobalt transporter
MSEDQSSNGSGRQTLAEKIGKAFSSQPRDLAELKSTLRNALANGILDADALAMIEGALEVSETQVRDAMIPRAQMVVVNIDASVDDFLPGIIESGHSRFPVIGEDKDQVEGILLAKDLLPHLAQGRWSFDLAAVIRPAMIIPESKRLNMLLRDFRGGRNHMAIVVDEYGGVSGLITIEDVLEEIVGEIDDEFDEEIEAPIIPLGAKRYQIQALTPITDLNDMFQATLDSEDHDTIGGLLLAEFGRVPEFDDVVVVADRFEFKVIQADSRRIITLEMNDLA